VLLFKIKTHHTFVMRYIFKSFNVITILPTRHNICVLLYNLLNITKINPKVNDLHGEMEFVTNAY